MNKNLFTKVLLSFRVVLLVGIVSLETGIEKFAELLANQVIQGCNHKNTLLFMESYNKRLNSFPREIVDFGDSGTFDDSTSDTDWCGT